MKKSFKIIALLMVCYGSYAAPSPDDFTPIEETTAHDIVSPHPRGNVHQKTEIVVTKPLSNLTPEELRLLEERVTILEHKQKKDERNRPIDPVLALPQAPLREKYNAAPVYNQDLAMLKMRRAYQAELKDRDIQPLPYPHIEFGGSIIGLGMMRRPAKLPPINGRMQSDLNLAGANLDANADITDYLLGNVRISYDPNPPEKINESTILTRVSGSRIFLNTAFLTLGDLRRFPFYLSAGQMFLPFGEYRSSLLTAPLPARIGRMRQRPVLLGYNSDIIPGLTAQLFGFRGDAIIDKKSGVVNNGGGNIDYSRAFPWLRFHIGGSYVGNIADAGGMQNTGPSTIVSDAGEFVDNEFLDEEDEEELEEDLPPEEVLRNFRGFGANEDIRYRVPAWNARGRIDLIALPLTFYGELVRPTRAFSPENLTFNELGARPSAWNTEGAYRFNIFDYPSAFIVGYGRSKEALALNLPKWSSGATLRIKFHRFLGIALGYQFDKAYDAEDFATGQLLPVLANRFVGSNTKTWTAQVNARF